MLGASSALGCFQYKRDSKRRNSGLHPRNAGDRFLDAGIPWCGRGRGWRPYSRRAHRRPSR
jgi:hypothetical protein